MNTLILLATLMIMPSDPAKDITYIIPDFQLPLPHLVLRAQDPVDGMVYGWCVDEKGWHEFEAESAKDYLEAGFRACKEAK